MPQVPFPDTADQPPIKFRVRQFGGFNNNVPRSAIADSQFFWIENLMPLAAGDLRSTYAEGAAVYTTTSTFKNVYFFNVAEGPHVIMFFQDGSAVDIDTIVFAPATIATAGTFSSSANVTTNQNPVATQWNANGIVIISQVTANAFWTWDGITLTSNGSNAPTWLTDGLLTPMPSGVRGNALEVYQNRLWVSTPFARFPPTSPVSTLSVSAPANGADFASADGGNVTPAQDATLRLEYNALKQSNGFLYAFGDSNVSQIYNVQTAGSPPLTTYFNQNVDPQVGCTWQNTVQQIGQAIIFANQQGVYAMNGGVPQKISYELDKLFAGANFAIAPTAAVGFVFGIKCYMIAINARDQTNTLRTFICAWDTKEWFILSTINAGLTAIYTQLFNGMLTVWGTDATHLFKLFQVPSASLQKILISKLWAGGESDGGYAVYKKAYRFYAQAIDYSGAGVTITGTVDNDSTTTVALPSLSVAATGTTVTGGDVSAYGRLLGVTQNFSGSDFSLIDFALEYSEDAPFLG
jgi:hypothetical protein